MLQRNSISTLRCKYCQSPNVIRFGTHKGVQRYYCKDCKRKFVLDTLPKAKPTTERQKKSAYMRKAVRRSAAKKRITIPRIATLRG